MNLLIYVSILILLINNCFAYDEEHLKNFLSEGRCNKCDLSGANFPGQYLDRVIITDSNMTGTNFDDAKFAAVIIKSSNFSNASFNNTDMPSSSRRLYFY